MARPKKTTDTREHVVGQEGDIDLAGTERFSDQIETVDTPNWKDLAKMAEFYEQPVHVFVHESPDPNAELIVDVYNNGIPQRFIRGQWQTVKRKFVEVLARAKTETVNTYEARGEDGAMQGRVRSRSALRYPFDMRDENPNGQRWLRAVLAEA